LARIPLWLASGGRRNTELCAELCDGWLPMGMPPEGVGAYREEFERGFARRGGRPPSFEVFSGCNVEITDDVAAAYDRMRPLTAMYVGGMGSATHNFHREAMARRGFPEAAARIQELWLAGRKQEAVAAVPDDYLEQGSLVGTVQRIRRKWDTVAAPGVTGLIVGAQRAEELRLLAELAGTREQDEDASAVEHLA
jgi:alkanesulfonate monooxygenase SsuD/methylene tetrahydromethanopterin reductase-like flavin-dependent oxidoreductase (luciferase family)